MKPKKKCCTSKPRCRRCPIRLLREGKLPPGFTVRRRRLVKVDGAGSELLSGDVKRPDKDTRPKKKKQKKAKQGSRVTLAA